MATNDLVTIPPNTIGFWLVGESSSSVEYPRARTFVAFEGLDSDQGYILVLLAHRYILGRG